MMSTYNMLITCLFPSGMSIVCIPWYRYNYWNWDSKWLGHCWRSLVGKWAQECVAPDHRTILETASSCYHIPLSVSIHSSWASNSSIFILPLSGLIWGSLHVSFKDIMICWTSGGPWNRHWQNSKGTSRISRKWLLPALSQNMSANMSTCKYHYLFKNCYVKHVCKKVQSSLIKQMPRKNHLGEDGDYLLLPGPPHSSSPSWAAPGSATWNHLANGGCHPFLTCVMVSHPRWLPVYCGLVLPVYLFILNFNF